MGKYEKGGSTYAEGGEIERLIKDGNLIFSKTKKEHSDIYGIDSNNPLFIQHLCIDTNNREKGLGKKVIDHIEDYAIRNNHDLIFGHISIKSKYGKKDICDAEKVKSWMVDKGYNIAPDTNDFYKKLSKRSSTYAQGGEIKVGDKVKIFKDEPFLIIKKVNEFADKGNTYSLASEDGKIKRNNISHTKIISTYAEGGEIKSMTNRNVRVFLKLPRSKDLSTNTLYKLNGKNYEISYNFKDDKTYLYEVTNSGNTIIAEIKNEKPTYAEGGGVKMPLELKIVHELVSLKESGHLDLSESHLKTIAIQVANKIREASTGKLKGKGAPLFVAQELFNLKKSGNLDISEDNIKIIATKFDRTWYAEGGEINTKVDTLKKGDTISIEFGSSFSKDNKVTLKVRSRNKVRKGTVDKITFENADSPSTVRYYAYERGDGVWRFAKGDSAISNINITDSYAKGGEVMFTDLSDNTQSRKEWESRKSKHTNQNSFGSFSHKINNRTVGSYYLYRLSNYDENYYSHIPLKDGEILARVETDNMVGGEMPLVKINILNGRVYFMSEENDLNSDEDDKNPKFDRASADVLYLSLDNQIKTYEKFRKKQKEDGSSYAKGGMIYSNYFSGMLSFLNY